MLIMSPCFRYLSDNEEQALEMAKFKTLTLGGEPLISVFEFDENGVVTNFEDYIEDAEITFKLTSFDSSAQVVSETDIYGLSDCFNKESSMLTGIYSYGENYIVDLVNGLVLVSKSGELLDFNNDEMNGVRLGKDSNGDILCAFTRGIGYMDNETLSQPSEIINTSDKIYHHYFLDLLIHIQNDKVKKLLCINDDIIFEDTLEMCTLNLSRKQQVKILEILLEYKEKIKYNINIDLMYTSMLIEIGKVIK